MFVIFLLPRQRKCVFEITIDASKSILLQTDVLSGMNLLVEISGLDLYLKKIILIVYGYTKVYSYKNIL